MISLQKFSKRTDSVDFPKVFPKEILFDLAFSCEKASWSPRGTDRESAAMILLMKTGRTWKVLLIRRSASMRAHAGQVGLPGGRRDPSDSNPIHTALRETEEETCIPQESIKPLGMCSGVIGNDGAPIHVVLAWCVKDQHSFLPNNEVSEFFLVAIEDLQRVEARSFEFNLFGVRRKSILFQTEQCNIWGLTAQMIYNANLRLESRA